MGVTAVPTAIEEYLDTDYSPDREFVDGAVVERHLGERSHSLVQRKLVGMLVARYPNIFVWPGQRVRTNPNRCRIPDVCVTERDPLTDVF